MNTPESALVFPSPLPEWVTSNIRRNAEVRVYRALQDQLKAPWHIFYSRPWIGLDKNGQERDGEADFVLLHPDLGMLVLEVKGGTVRREDGTEKWYSTDAEGESFRIKNPVQQAATCKHRLLEKFKELEGWNGRYITARHAVVFPTCSKPICDLGPDMPRWLFAGHEDMDRLGEWVENRLEEHISGEDNAPDNLDYDGVALVRSYLSGGFELERPAGASLVADDESIRTMTDQQAMILDMLDSVVRIAIPGPAGTGKTALAVEKAKRLARAGKKTLLTCFNRPLARQLERDIGNMPNLLVRSFHSLCTEIAERARIAVPGAGRDASTQYFQVALPQALERALASRPDERFDAVVIDEGQDFPETWARSVDSLLKAPKTSPLFVFFDDNQKVFGKGHSLAANIPSQGLRLSRILRSGKLIVQGIGPLLQPPFIASGPQGEPIEWIESAGSINTDRIAYQLDELIDRRQIASRHIAVIVADEFQRRAIVESGRIGRHVVADAEAAAGNAVVCDTIRRFKGLERAAVILVEPERVLSEPAVLYVGLTRARILLQLLAPAGNLAQLRLLLS